MLAAISSPAILSGQSTAFEATVNVEIRKDGTTDPLAEDIVVGGSMGETCGDQLRPHGPRRVLERGTLERSADRS